MAGNHRRVRHMGVSRAALRRRRTKRTEEEKKRLKRKALVLPAVLAAVGILSAILFVAVDNRDIFSLEQFLHPDLYNTVEIGGVRCRRRTRIKSYLFMGVDARGKVGEYYNDVEYGAGQCDVLMLVIVDQNANTYTVFPINRNIITTMNVLSEDGEKLGEKEGPICLAHSYGNGRGNSCENAVDALSRLLYDQPIDGYLALNMDCIGIINHQLGGVTVTIEDDFSDSDPSLKMGETVKLTDEQAVHFIHDRMNVGDGSNMGRMRRQQQFLDAAQPILYDKIMNDEKFFRGLYDALEDYMVTSLTGKDISKLAKAFRSNEFFEPPEIEGEVIHDEFGYSQIIADEDSVAEDVLQLFYEKV